MDAFHLRQILKVSSVSTTDDIWPIHLGMQLLDLKYGPLYLGFKILFWLIRCVWIMDWSLNPEQTSLVSGTLLERLKSLNQQRSTLSFSWVRCASVNVCNRLPRTKQGSSRRLLTSRSGSRTTTPARTSDSRAPSSMSPPYTFWGSGQMIKWWIQCKKS